MLAVNGKRPNGKELQGKHHNKNQGQLKHSSVTGDEYFDLSLTDEQLRKALEQAEDVAIAEGRLPRAYRHGSEAAVCNEFEGVITKGADEFFDPSLTDEKLLAALEQAEVVAAAEGQILGSL